MKIYIKIVHFIIFVLFSPIIFADSTYLKEISIPNSSYIDEEPGGPVDLFAILVYQAPIPEAKKSTEKDDATQKTSSKMQTMYRVMHFPGMREHKVFGYLQHHIINKKLIEHDPKNYQAYLHFFDFDSPGEPADMLLTKIFKSRKNKTGGYSDSVQALNQKIMSRMEHKFDYIGTVQINPKSVLNTQTKVSDDGQRRIYIVLEKIEDNDTVERRRR